MKSKLFFLLAWFLTFGFTVKAQNTFEATVPIIYCQDFSNQILFTNSTCEVMIVSYNGIPVWQESVNNISYDPMLDAYTVYANFTFNEIDAPYYLVYDKECLADDYILVHSPQPIPDIPYFPPYSNVTTSDPMDICLDYYLTTVEMLPQNYCDNLPFETYMALRETLFESSCEVKFYDANHTLRLSLPLNQSFIETFQHVDFQDFIIGFEEPMVYIEFDEFCVNSLGVTMEEYNFSFPLEIYNYLDDYDVQIVSIVFCIGETEQANTGTINLSIEDCSNNTNEILEIIDDCYFFIATENSEILTQGTFGEFMTFDNSNNTYSLEMDVSYYDSLLPFYLVLDYDCLEGNGIYFDEYIFDIDEFTDGAWSDETCYNVNDSSGVDCYYIAAQVSPVDGYFQNNTSVISFSWLNYSSVSANVTVKITLPEDVLYLSSSNTNLNFEVNGNEYTYTSTLQPFEQISTLFFVLVPGNIFDDEVHTYEIEVIINQNSIGSCDEDMLYSSLDLTVGNSYDPNAKTVNQPKILSPDIQDEFIYTVYFQNTGTAPAQNVYILDTISENLDLSTFEIIKFSHEMEVIELENRTIKFNFPQIWLPDSTSNPEGSNGFVKYRIKENSNNGHGSEIFNTAYIYFDQNEAIITNTTVNINESELSLDNPTLNLLKVYPNPVKDRLNIVSESKIDNVYIYSIDGQLCYYSSPVSNEFEIDVRNLTKGIYLIKLSDNSNFKTVRFIKE